MTPVGRTWTVDRKVRALKGKSRILVGTARHLTGDQAARQRVVALAAKKDVNELSLSSGRTFSDGQEVLVKFIVWR